MLLLTQEDRRGVERGHTLLVDGYVVCVPVFAQTAGGGEERHLECVNQLSGHVSVH